MIDEFQKKAIYNNLRSLGFGDIEITTTYPSFYKSPIYYGKFNYRNITLYFDFMEPDDKNTDLSEFICQKIRFMRDKYKYVLSIDMSDFIEHQCAFRACFESGKGLYFDLRLNDYSSYITSLELKYANIEAFMLDLGNIPLDELISYATEDL